VFASDRLCYLLDANRDGRGEFEWVVERPGVGRMIERKETYDQTLYTLPDSVLMFIAKQSTTRKLQSRVDAKQDVLERAIASSHPSVHPQLRESSSAGRLTQTPQSPTVLAQSCPRFRESGQGPNRPYLSVVLHTGVRRCTERTRCRSEGFEDKLRFPRSYIFASRLQRFSPAKARRRFRSLVVHETKNLYGNSKLSD